MLMELQHDGVAVYLADLEMAPGLYGRMRKCLNGSRIGPARIERKSKVWVAQARLSVAKGH